MDKTNELTGEIVHIGEVEQLKGGAEKRVFAIEIEPGQYSQQIGFELFKDKISIINPFSVGDTITVYYNHRGREYQGKFYVNLQCWRIAASNDSNATAPVSEDDDIEF